jgi:peptidoglycan hydrolase-like protein with peptidoglycan-binding domain
MHGADVKTLQHDLTKAGAPTPATGEFNSLTARHVRGFEKDNNLAVNGIVTRSFVRQMAMVLDGLTMTAVAANSTSGGGGLPTSGSGTAATKKKTKKKTKVRKATTVVKQDGGSSHLGERTLRQGKRGHDVRVLQGYLTAIGYPTQVDGDFGPTTKRNVIAFEKANHLKANGVVTYHQAMVLRQLEAKAETTSTGPTGKIRIGSNGEAIAPKNAPAVVVKLIAAANRIIDKPYIYAGGHASWNASGYDCSGSVSYALHGAGLLSSPEDSTGLESYGSPGKGKWVTIYADASHTWIVVAGRAFDTADYGGPNIPSGSGPRWRTNPTGNLADGGDYVIRHPSGL